MVEGKQLKLAPSILSADFAHLSESVAKIREAEYVHVDIMDGTFVPNISFGAAVMKSIRKDTDQIFDVHLMVQEPIRYLADFKEAGADILCVHAEACVHLDRTIEAIKELGVKAAVALNPATPVETVKWVLDKVDMVLVMSVNPGFGGQSFLPYSLDKIREVSTLLKERGLEDKVDIEVDGGVNLDNVSEIIDAGANVIVAGSAVYRGAVQDNVKAFHEIFAKKSGV